MSFKVHIKHETGYCPRCHEYKLLPYSHKKKAHGNITEWICTHCDTKQQKEDQNSFIVALIAGAIILSGFIWCLSKILSFIF